MTRDQNIFTQRSTLCSDGTRSGEVSQYAFTLAMVSFVDHSEAGNI
jgi:hypothetical protein